MMLSIHFSYLVNIIEFDAREKNQYVFWMGHIAWSQRTVYDAEYCFMEIWIVYIACVTFILSAYLRPYWLDICSLAHTQTKPLRHPIPNNLFWNHHNPLVRMLWFYEIGHTHTLWAHELIIIIIYHGHRRHVPFHKWSNPWNTTV